VPARSSSPTLVLSVLGVLASATTLAQGIEPADFPGPMQLAMPVSQAKSPGDIYIVQLRDSAAAAYAGGVAGFSATKPGAGQAFDPASAAAERYVGYLEQSHDKLLASIGGGSKIYSYRYAMNGFSAKLTPAELTRLARHPDVVGIWRDVDHRLETNNSSLFLGLLDQNGGLRADLGLTGEDVIVAVIDSGVDPNHPSLQDFEEQVPRTCRSAWAEGSWLGFLLCWSTLRNPPIETTYQPIEGFDGICQEGEAFPASSCNNKLIGARYYIDGFLLRHELDDSEYLSAKDVDGHGTHIATIIGGNHVTADLFGTRIGEISGIAPRARIAVYKACWLTPGDTRATCTSSDLARAIDDAVADGVDIINYSIGSLEPDLTAPEDIALLNALDAGVLSVVAAGNNGPANFTLGSPGSAPWVLTVAASTQTGTRYEQAIEVTAPASVAGLAPMREARFTPALEERGPIEAAVVLADDGQSRLGDGTAGSTRDACEPLRNGGELSGAIALIERGGCTFQLKLEHAEAAGAAAAIVYTTSGEPVIMNGEDGSVGIPGVMIGPADGNILADAWLGNEKPAARLEHGLLADIRETGNQMASFSSRGPAIGESDFIKPDITAPGVQILAGTSPDVLNGIPDAWFQYRSGTSMAAPMIAGIAALLKEAEPDWSPATLKSALMTTAYDEVVTANSSVRANPFDMGTGHVDANSALNPGLIYETGYADYRAFLCGLDNVPIDTGDCDSLLAAGFTSHAEALNLPSIGITELIPGDEITRTVTNIGTAAVFAASVESPPGMTVTVSPASLALGEGESASFSLRFESDGAPYNYWQFGRLSWSDGQRSVDSPIAAQPVLMRVQPELTLDGQSGAGELEAAFGYTGEYLASVHGLHAPGLDEPGFVTDDAENDFSFRFDNGVNAHFFTIGPEELYLRVALFDALTDGNDDLDLYLYHCPTLASCVQVGQSGNFTSDEQIDVLQPAAGLYAALVHGFETDPANGAGANYRILGWSFGPGGDQGNFSIDAPGSVVAGNRLSLPYEFSVPDPETIYLGGVSHNTPFDVFYLTVVTANFP